MFAVYIHNRYWQDFVTSSLAVMLFPHEDEAWEYVCSSAWFHRDRFWYQVKEVV